MKKFLIELADEVCVQLERAAVDAKAAGRFGFKRGGKKAMAEFILTQWAAAQGDPGGLHEGARGELRRPVRPAKGAPKTL